MINRINSLLKGYESKAIEADENLKLLLQSPKIIPDHTNLNEEIDKWVSVKSSNISKYNILASYIPKEEKKDG